MPSRIRTTGVLLRKTFDRCMKHNTPMLAAALAFYTLLSLAPGLWIVLAGVGAVIGKQSARSQIISWAAEMMGSGGATFVGSLLDGMASNSSFATVAGVISMLFGATVAFGALQDSLNLIWDVPPTDSSYIKDFFSKRVLSFAAVVALGVLLLASVVTSTAIAAVARFAPQFLPAPELPLQVANFVAAMIFLTFLFGMIYRILPDARVEWHDVWMGASVTALLFSLGKTIIGLYLGHASSSSAYGAAGSLVVLLLWVYYSAQIFLFGAEFTEVYASGRRSLVIAPGSNDQVP